MKRTAVTLFGWVVLGSALLPGRAPALDPALARQANTGMAQLYRLEFDEAMSTFENMKKAFPDHPAPATLQAAAIWWRSRYSFADPSKEASRDLERYVREAVKLGKKMARDPGRACEANLFVGGALGVAAHWELLEGSWFSAAMDARAAVNTLRPIMACTEYADEAAFGLAMYEFAATNLPWTLRWISSVLISDMNNRDRSLERFARAATGGQFLRSDAQGSLVIAYTYYVPDPEKAAFWSGQMVKERPDSPMAAGLRMQTLAYSRDFDGTIAFADKWLVIVGARGKESSAFHYWRGIGLMGKRMPAEAEEAFTASLAGQGRPVWKAAALLKRGCARDIQGNRSGAILDYRAMKKANDPWLEADRASIYLKRPFTWEDFPREISPRGF
jgi:hypothetical protein